MNGRHGDSGPFTEHLLEEREIGDVARAGVLQPLQPRLGTRKECLAMLHQRGESTQLDPQAIEQRYECSVQIRQAICFGNSEGVGLPQQQSLRDPGRVDAKILQVGNDVPGPSHASYQHLGRRLRQQDLGELEPEVVGIIAERHQSWAVELLLGEQRHKFSGGRRQQDPPRRQNANLFGCMSFCQALLNKPDQFIVKVFMRNESVVRDLARKANHLSSALNVGGVHIEGGEVLDDPRA